MPHSRDIAIVGMACRFPQAPDLDAYWDNILKARVCFSEIPADRWNNELFYHPGSRELDKSYARKVGFLTDDIWQFAAVHYGMPPLRVKVTDPQHRILLDAVRGALADAGYEKRELPRQTTGVFVGASVAEHKDLHTARLRGAQLADGQFGQPFAGGAEAISALEPIRAFSIAGNLLNMSAATVAQQYDLGGPAFAIDAACSSSLVATYEAMTYLRAGVCDVAIASGVYLNLVPDNLVGFSRIGAVSKSDACRPFDADADGFVLGEGVGAVILKRLADAERDGDRVYAVIRGAGINNDGRGDGPMTPRKGGQIAVLERAYADAGVTPDTIGFIEAHGTATGVGDVTEVGALADFFGRRAAGPVDTYLSSVKANIGHTMSAAGVAGLIKAALVLHERRIPPQAAYARPHPDLALGESFKVTTEERPWPQPAGRPRRAAVSSFGFGGTNCHLVLEEHVRPTAAAAAEPLPFVVSAPTPALLGRYLGQLQHALTDGLAARASVADVATTLALRTRERAAVGFVASTRAELLARLADAERVVAGTPVGGISFSAAPLADPRVAFLFPGQGAQAVGVCRALYQRFPRFRARLDALGGDLVKILYPTPPYDHDAATRALVPTEVCQPILAALGLALADLLADHGVLPAMTLGHSLGELVAAGAAGMLPAEATVRLVAERGRIIRDLQLADAGAMAAIAAERSVVEPYLAAVPGVVLANLNHPTQVVASGTTAGVTALIERLAAAGITAKRLPVSHAFHSPLMQGATAPLAALLASLDLTAPRVPVISCIDVGRVPSSPDAVRDLFVRHTISPVNFVAGVEAAAAAGANVLIQLGAGSALLSMARATLVGRPPAAAVSLAALEGDDGSRFVAALAELAVIGVPVDLRPLAEDAHGTWLPSCPLETESYRVVNKKVEDPMEGKDRRPAATPTPAAAATGAPPGAQNDALVALFREQMAVLQAQTDIIRRQTEALSGQPLLMAAFAPVPRPSAPTPTVTATAPVAAPAPAAIRPTPPAVPDDIDTKLLDLVSAVSAFPRASLDLDKKLGGDLGFDSLMIVELSGKLGDAFPGVGALPKSLFVNDPTLRTLSTHIARTLREPTTSPSASASAPAVPSEVTRYRPELTPRPITTTAPSGQGPITILPDSTGVAAALDALLADSRATRPAGPILLDLRGLDAGAADAATLRTRALGALHAVRSIAPRPAIAVFAHRGVAGAGAGLAGFAKALAREWPDTTVKAVAFDDAAAADAANAPPSVIAAGLLAELGATDATVEIVYRGATRHVVTLAASPAPAPASRLTDGLAVAITGGTRGLGAKLALELARRCHARLALLGRTAPPADLLAAITAAGGRASHHACDVTDAAQVFAAVTAARQLHGPFAAVVHAAGVLADGPVDRKTDADFTRVFDTKVAGALALFAATASDPLQAFLLFSSWAGRFGNAAQTDYSAASAALAALAVDFGARRPGVRFAAVAIPPWDGTAMVDSIPAPVRAAMRAAGVTFLDDATGLDLLVRELAAGGPSGEVVFGRDLPVADARDVTRLVFASATHPWLDDHRVAGHPVVPLAAAASLALDAARRVTGEPVQLGALELDGGIVLDSDGRAKPVTIRATTGRRTEIEIATADGLAYRAIALPPGSALPALIAPPAQTPPLPVATFYARHTFHGPRLQGIVSVDGVSPTHVSGTVRSARPGEIAGDFTIDPLFLDSCFQLAAYWAFAEKGRAGLPLGIGELRLVRPIPAGSELRCLLVFAGQDGDLFNGDIDCRDAQGELVLQLRGVRAELRAVSQPKPAPAPASTAAAPAATAGPLDDLAPEHYRIEEFPAYKELRQKLDMAKAMGIGIPYFNVHERVTANTSIINGREVLNFSSYNYLGLSGDPDVTRAAAEAAERYGTSVSASRIASGEKPLHHELEHGLAEFLGTEDAIVMVGGHATNVGVIGHLFGPGDLIVHDALAHDSILGGAKLSGARRRPFAHNDPEALDALLTQSRRDFKKVLIAVEGTYSMDGDIPPLDEFIRVKKKHKAMMLVDEAHSFGVVGATGRGVGELFGVDRRDVELWMGTLSKSLASCGGYIAGSRAAVEYLKYTTPAFVYSVGISPPNAAAALAALRKLDAHPELVTLLRRRAQLFLDLCRRRGIDTGMSEGTAVIPCIVGNSWDCLQLSQALTQRAINVQPILYPAVEEHLARLRFFISAKHTEDELTHTADVLCEELMKLNPSYLHRRRPLVKGA